MRYIIIFISIFLVGCEDKNPYEGVEISLVNLKRFELEKISVRSMVLLDRNVAFAGSDATFGFINTENQTMALSNLKNRGVISDFRSVAATSEHFFMLSIGNPALLYKAEATGMEEVYREEHPEVFYDAMDFIDEVSGVAIGDPIEGRLLVIITNDGGRSWEKLTWSQAPKVEKGEAVFAASNSAMAHQGKKLWVATGGSKSRLFYSDNRGYKWEELSVLPLTQGSMSKGAFSIAFYDERQGIVAGGDYEHPEVKEGSMALTEDGGRSWEVIPADRSIGYTSCVKYIPNSKGNALVACSPLGLFFSNDKGKRWTRIGDEEYYSLLFIDEERFVASGNGKISIFKIVKK